MCLSPSSQRHSTHEERDKAFNLSLDLVRRVHIADGVATHLFCSPSFSHVLGHAPASLLGDVRSCTQLLGSEQLSQIGKMCEAFELNKLPNGHKVEYPFLSADGTQVWCEHKLSFDPDRTCEVVIISRDISERREKEQLEVRIREDRAEAAKREAILRAQAHSSINHTSKRVLSNARAMCDLVSTRLELLGVHDERINTLLASTKAETTAGLNVCFSALLTTRSLASDRHTPTIQGTTMADVFRSLGWIEHPRYSVTHYASAPFAVDVASLLAVLFNGGQNALQHGQSDGAVEVSSELQTWSAPDGDADEATPRSRLSVEIRSLPGSNHGELLKLGIDDLVEASRRDPTLFAQHRLGSSDSTFLGLEDVRNMVERHLEQPASVKLLVRADCMVFQLHCIVTNLPTTPSGLTQVTSTPVPVDALTEGASPPRLPEGLVFCCVDDDAIPRIVAETLIEQAGAHPRSRILGETYAEVAGLVDLVCGLASELGPTQVILCVDENLCYPEGSFKGADLCHELRTAHNFNAVVIIHSANDEPEATRKYIEAGADGYVSKVASGNTSIPQAIINCVAAAHHRRFGAQPCV